MNGRYRRLLYISFIVLASLAALVLVGISPFALDLLARSRANWGLLSNIGQTYGAISALLAAVGLSGVVVSILLQVRESRRAHVDIIRTHHFQLSRAVMEDSSLAEISGGTRLTSSRTEQKQAIFLNLQLRFWLMLWEMRSLPEIELRVYVQDIFSTSPGKRYWEKFGASRIASVTAPKEKHFLQVINEEYLKAASDEDRSPTETGKTPTARVVRAAAVGAVIALSADAVIRRSILQSTRRLPDRPWRR